MNKKILIIIIVFASLWLGTLFLAYRHTHAISLDDFINSSHAKKEAKEDELRLRKDWAYLKKYTDENSKLAPPIPGENRVVFMGNSITRHWIKLDPDFFSGNYIDRGISGQTTSQMLVRFRQDVINLKPAAVVMLDGINDIIEITGPFKLEDTFGNIQSMVQLAQAAHIKVILSSLLPTNHIPDKPGIVPTEKITLLNQMIKDYATKNNIIYIDYYSAMVDDKNGLPEALTSDGLHPTLAGYKIMEPLAEKAIKETLKN